LNNDHSELTMSRHRPVLLPQVLDALLGGALPVRRLIDGTLGAGGHTSALLQAGVSEVIAIDLDPVAIRAARRQLADADDRVTFCQSSYLRMRELADEQAWEAVDAILLDLGLSSLQLDQASRGFAFRLDAPLDMRFDQTAAGPTAADLVNGLAQDELADIFFRLGEESAARKIARAIVQARPIRSTAELADLVAGAVSSRRRRAKIHPATKVFQALRIAVNGELDAVATVLPLAVELLRPGGRLAVITFHSLEDRIVKRCFRDLATEVVAPPGMASIEGRRARVRLITRKPIRPDAAEIMANPRARSAKLRVVEKLDCT
jgi:16S rRNA (cytosine1402-N4)-methyltransferase